MTRSHPHVVSVVAAFAFLAASVSTTGAQTLNEAFLRSTVLVTFKTAPNKESSGTGFFVFRPVKGDKGHVLLITNKHLLPPEGSAQFIRIRVAVGPAEKPSVRFVEVPVVGQNGKYLPNVRLHPKQGFDVAAVNVTGTFVKRGIQAARIPLDLLATRERLKNENITVGDEIFLLGYPGVIFDARNVSPILRSGVIATVPLEGYAFNDMLRDRFGLPDRIDGFLIDANVFPGSSGSIVVLKPQPTTIGPVGELVLSAAKKVPYVLGIVSKSILYSDQQMGLGIVYSAEAIRTVIEMFYK